MAHRPAHDPSDRDRLRRPPRRGALMTRLLTLTAFALLPMVARAEGYICVTDMATGFAYKAGAWRSTSFMPKEKFLVVRASGGEAPQVKWGVWPLGEEQAIAWCRDEFDKSGDLVCKETRLVDVTFKMNKNTLRFLYAYLVGYWDRTAANESKDTPAIAIGKCSPMSE